MISTIIIDSRGFCYRLLIIQDPAPFIAFPKARSFYVFDVQRKKWKTLPVCSRVARFGLATLACDSIGNRLAVIGADKEGNQLGWCRTAIDDIATGKWEPLAIPDKEIVREHQERVATMQALIDLRGRSIAGESVDQPETGIAYASRTITIRGRPK